VDKAIREKFERLVKGEAFNNLERKLIRDFKEDIKKIYDLNDVQTYKKLAATIYTKKENPNNLSYRVIRDFVENESNPQKLHMKKIQTLVNLIQELKGTN
tara:strand:+ start:167 stop:466 length:300 start_codon:yes stop_codon:yes gene_type:complete